MGLELLRQFDCLDVVVSGEGEIAFPSIVDLWLTKRRLPESLPGVFTRAGLDGAPVIVNASSVQHMDDLPIPDYSDFLDQWCETTLGHTSKPVLLYESSRGCWWGERNHCTFCGLNGGNIAYRSKSQRRALDELKQLMSIAEQNNVKTIAAVDNILDLKYFSEFVPALADAKRDLGMFYEVKVNLRKEQVEMLRRAGITHLQPGIESLSTTVLKLMRKGVRGLQNIQLLKFCKELSVTAEWNMLFGFPGEQPHDYEPVLALMPSLTHLRPPTGTFPIRLDRFSPNFDRSGEMGLIDVAPFPAYDHVYAISKEAQHNIAYYFTYGYRDEHHAELYADRLMSLVDVWKREHEASDLLWIDEGDKLRVIDTRPIALAPVSELKGSARLLMLFCDSMRSFDEIRGRLVERFGYETLSNEEVSRILLTLESLRFIVREGNLYLSLAIQLGTYPLTQDSVLRFKQRMRDIRRVAPATIESLAV